MASPPLNIVLIGLGMVADTHLMALADLPEKLHLHGLYSRSAERVEGFASKVEDICGYRPRCYESLHQIASDQTLDMAIIATPTQWPQRHRRSAGPGWPAYPDGKTD